MLKEKSGPSYSIDFAARSGQFKLFKKRYSLHNVEVSGKSVSADVKKAEEYGEILRLIVEEN